MTTQTTAEQYAHLYGGDADLYARLIAEGKIR